MFRELSFEEELHVSGGEASDWVGCSAAAVGFAAEPTVVSLGVMSIACGWAAGQSISSALNSPGPAPAATASIADVDTTPCENDGRCSSGDIGGPCGTGADPDGGDAY